VRWTRALGPLGLLALALAGCGADSAVPAAALYHRSCARCHGDDGRGDPRSVGLYPGLDLTSSRIVRAGARGLVFQRIADGTEAMPGFSDHLETEDMQHLVDYVLRLPREKASR
jgi:mono/diheme cytochrome c family protein